MFCLMAGVSRAECVSSSSVDLNVDSEILVKPIRDVLHLTRGPADVAHKQTVRRYLAEAFHNASSLASSHANKSFVEEQQFDGVTYLRDRREGGREGRGGRGREGGRDGGREGRRRSERGGEWLGERVSEQSSELASE